nr:MAG: Tail spike receptor binding N-terminal domain [Bacteriophage sp.]
MSTKVVKKKLTDLPIYSGVTTNLSGSVHYREGGVDYQLPAASLVTATKTFVNGFTIYSSNEEVIFNGQRLTWTGTYPKTVVGGSTPDTTGGIGSGAWAYSDDSSLRTYLAGTTGAAGVGLGLSPISEQAEVNLFRFMTSEDRITMQTSVGAEVPVDYALQACISAGYKSVRFPHQVVGIYTLNGSVTLPSAFTIYGECSKPYTVTGDTSFNNKGTVIRKALSANYLFGAGSVFRIYGCILDGRDNLRPLINNTNQVRGGILHNCGIYRFLYGIGSYAYTSMTVSYSSICANTYGIRNLIDSRIINCTVNANTADGVNQQAGSNNNIFQNVRNEWNGGIGYYFYGSVGNIITGELIDRSGSANVVVLAGGGCIIGDVFSQRPGRTASAGSAYNTHFYVGGSGSYLQLTGVKTRSGKDDTGGSVTTISPERVIVTGGTETDMVIQVVGCDMVGYTISALREVIVADTKIFRGNIGLPDLVTSGLYQLSSGRQTVGSPKLNQGLATGVGATLTLTFDHPPMNDPSSSPASVPKVRTLLIESRTSASTNIQTSMYSIKFLIRRIASSAAVSILSSTETNSTSGLWGVTSPTGVSVALSISSDATTITVTLTSIDGLGRFIDCYILPS